MTNYFEYSNDGITIQIEYGPKDFTASFASEYGLLKIYRHMMFMCPKLFSEELLRKEYCKDIATDIHKTLDFLNVHPDFIQTEKQNLIFLIEPIYKELDILRQKKSELKKKFKAGEIFEKKYTAVINRIKELEFQSSQTKWKYFKEIETKNKMDLSAVRDLICQGDM